jgi:hypothetical protein
MIVLHLLRQSNATAADAAPVSAGSLHVSRRRLAAEGFGVSGFQCVRNAQQHDPRLLRLALQLNSEPLRLRGAEQFYRKAVGFG